MTTTNTTTTTAPYYPPRPPSVKVYEHEVHPCRIFLAWVMLLIMFGGLAALTGESLAYL